MSDPMTSTTAPVQQNYATDGTTISAAALATRIAALEAQIALAQRDNTKLIARIVELEHERDRAMLVVATAVSLVSRAEGLADMLGGLGHAHVDAGNYATLRRVTAPYREGDGEDA